MAIRALTKTSPPPCPVRKHGEGVGPCGIHSEENPFTSMSVLATLLASAAWRCCIGDARRIV